MGNVTVFIDHLRNVLAGRNISVSPWPPARRCSRNLVELSTSPKTVLYVKEFNGKGPGFWGLTANQVDRLEKASVRWFSVLLLRSAVAGYVLTASDVNNCRAGAKLAKGDFKVREGKPAQGFQSLDELLRIIKTTQGPFDFSDIIPKLQSAGRGNRIRLPYDCNSIPSDVQGDCRPRLVVWIEEDADNSERIHEALRQVAETCRGITRAVLFVVDIDKAIWQDLWGSFQPGFAVEQKELELKIVIEFRP